MNKSTQIRLLLTILILIIAGVQLSFGQSSCNTAINQNLGSATEYNLTGTEYWIKFTADSSFVDIKLYRPNSSPNSQLAFVELFGGSCGSLNLINSMILSDSIMTENNLVNGYTYFIKLTQSQAISSYTGIVLAAQPINNIPIYCSTGCNLVPNGCFDESNINVDLMQYFTNGSNPNVYNDPLFPYNFFNNNLSNVCGWFTHTAKPQLKRESLIWGTNYYMFLMNYGGTSVESSMSRINNGNPLTTGKYLLRFKHKFISGNILGTRVYLDNSKYFNTGSRILIANKTNSTSTYSQEEAVVNITTNLTAYNYLMVEPYGNTALSTSGMMGFDEI